MASYRDDKEGGKRSRKARSEKGKGQSKLSNGSQSMGTMRVVERSPRKKRRELKKASRPNAGGDKEQIGYSKLGKKNGGKKTSERNQGAHQETKAPEGISGGENVTGGRVQNGHSEALPQRNRRKKNSK